MAAVARYGVLEMSPDETLNRVATLASRVSETPFATVSIVDTDRIWFKAVCGFDSLSHVDRGPGLGAAAVLQDAPLVVPDTLSDFVAASNPLVTGEWAIRFYTAAPVITADGYRLGMVEVLDTKPREVSDSALATLQDLAAVVMDELELRLSASTTLRHERALRKISEQDKATITKYASTLQRTLLPPSLPKVPGIELACHYHAASQQDVTGDFYDVFSLGDGRWAFFLGDVSGHGAEAATVTSLARHTLRAAALHNPDPVAILTELNAALLLDPQVPQLCTVLFGMLEPALPDGFDIVLAGGGHPPALWLRPDHNSVEEVWPRGGMLLGALADATFATSHLRLQPGHTLLFYTDGLTEARPDGEFFGEAGLTAFTRRNPATTATALVADLRALIDTFDPVPTDDVALLALSVPELNEAASTPTEPA